MNKDGDKNTNYIIYIILFILIIILLLVFHSCEKEEEKQPLIPIEKYNVIFNTNGGTLIEKQVLNDGEYVVEPLAPTKVGFEFAGWEFNGNIFDFNVPITSDLELSAVWKPIYYNINFDSNGGTKIYEQILEYGNKLKSPANPFKTGYEFVGWLKNGSKYNFDTPVTENFTLVAQWKKKKTIASNINVSNDYKGTFKVANTLLKYTINGSNTFKTNSYLNKTIVVQNTGSNKAYYALALTNFINDFNDDEITIDVKCVSYSNYNKKIVDGYCDSVKKTLKSSDVPVVEILLDGNSINSKYTHEYKISINYKNSSKKYLSGKIAIISNSLPNIFDVMDRDNDIFADNINSTFVKNATPGIDFTKQNSDTNGKGLYYTASTTLNEDYDGDGIGEVVYYYRGDVENNNLVYAGFCWKIIRTNENGSIKLRYNGKYTEENKCTVTEYITSSYFNHTYGDNSYLGYMMGLDNQCSESTCEGSILSTSYEQAHANLYDSSVKKVIDSWYESNIAVLGNNVTSKIANTIYCNDRSIKTKEDGYSGSYTQLGYGKNSTTYFGLMRAEGDLSPQFKCVQQNDQFTLHVDYGGTKSYGNNALKYPIALMTGDEFVYAGNISGVKNENNYLYFPTYYWSMTPGSSTTRAGSISLEAGAIYNDRVVYKEGVFPAISLYKDTLISSGDGTSVNPYIVK